MGETNTIIAVRVAERHVEIVTDRMWQWGVHAVGQSDSVDADGAEVVEVFTSVGDDPGAIRRALASLDAEWSVEVRRVDARVHSVPVEFLAPSWYRPDMVCVPAALMPIDVADDVLVTVIDPGAAFGLGDHATTRASMRLLADLIGRHRASRDGPASLLDVGCGTGVLGILAAQLGVPVIRAIDIADAAVGATRRNMELNDVVGSIEVDTAPIATIAAGDGGYDVITANILAPTIISMADDLKRLLRPLGSLIISGILADRHDHVLDALVPLVPVESHRNDGWIAVRLTRSTHGHHHDPPGR